jgi:hypothetical protein
MRRGLVIAGASAAAAAAAGSELTASHVRLNYSGISDAQARSIAEVSSAARDIYAREFAADMPDALVCTIRCGPGNEMHLFNDGKDSLSLSMPSAQKVAPPQQSGAFVLYGVCHELGHLAMYRTLKDRDWLTGAGAEGWAHYAGSVVVDLLYEAKGERLDDPRRAGSGEGGGCAQGAAVGLTYPDRPCAAAATAASPPSPRPPHA